MAALWGRRWWPASERVEDCVSKALVAYEHNGFVGCVLSKVSVCVRVRALVHTMDNVGARTHRHGATLWGAHVLFYL